MRHLLKLCEYQRKYREANREEICEKSREYREANREELCEKKREYYAANSEVIKTKAREKFECDCGGRYTRCHKHQHERSKKHQRWIEGNR